MDDKKKTMEHLTTVTTTNSDGEVVDFDDLFQTDTEEEKPSSKQQTKDSDIQNDSRSNIESTQNSSSKHTMNETKNHNHKKKRHSNRSSNRTGRDSGKQEGKPSDKADQKNTNALSEKQKEQMSGKADEAKQKRDANYLSGKQKEQTSGKTDEAKQKQDTNHPSGKQKEQTSGKTDEAKQKQDANYPFGKQKGQTFGKADEMKRDSNTGDRSDKQEPSAKGSTHTSEKKDKGNETKQHNDKKQTASSDQESKVSGKQQEKQSEETKQQNDTKSETAAAVELVGTQKLDRVLPPSEKKGNTLKIGLSVAAVLLVIVYASGLLYFSGHFYQNVTINGIDVSNQNKDDARQTLEQFYNNYSLTLDTIDGEKIEITGKEISMDVTLQEDVTACLKEQKSYAWFVMCFGEHHYRIDANVQWDEDALAELFNSMQILKEKEMTAPEDAYVGIEDGKLTIIKEVTGNKMLTGTFKKMVKQSLSEVQPELKLLEAGCYELPKVYDTDEELQKELEAKSEFAKNEIKLQLADLTLEPGMELYDAVLEIKGDDCQISKEKVEAYVADLAAKYDTVGTDRSFTTSFEGKSIEITGPTYGFELNQEETVDALYNALQAGKPATVNVVFEKEGYSLKGDNDIGDTYIEVNLSEQKVIAYKDGKKIAEGDCVSGNESAGHGTCIGLYAIQNKMSPTVLRGEKKAVTKTITKKKKGKKVTETKTTYEYEYESPVTYWMPFNGGIGLHDAAGWRSAYGGSIYYYSGSHGCVNLPLDLAKTLYENFEIGTPVVVYFWDNANRK